MANIYYSDCRKKISKIFYTTMSFTSTFQLTTYLFNANMDFDHCMYSTLTASGVHLKAVFWLGTMVLTQISRSRFTYLRF